MFRPALVAVVALATLVACSPSSDVFDPTHCDYEQATTFRPIEPADRVVWVDFDGDGVVVLCMWTSAS